MPGSVATLRDLLVDLVVHVADQRLVGVDHAGHAHRAVAGRSPTRTRIAASARLEVHAALRPRVGPPHVDDALRDPRAVLAARHRERRCRSRPSPRPPAGGARGRPARPTRRPSSRSPSSVDVEAAEQHPPRRHLVDERVQPVDEQQLVVGASQAISTACAARTARRIGDDRGQRERRLLEGLASVAPMPRTPMSAPCAKGSHAGGEGTGHTSPSL